MKLAGPVVAASLVLMTAVSSLSADFYVNGANTSPVAPYDAPEKAATTITEALAAAKDEIAANGGSAVVHVAVGTYDETGFALDGPIAVVGDSRDDVIVNSAVAGKRAFTLSHADAVVRNLTITGAGLRTNGGQGGHVNVSAGLVADCVISGGKAAASGYCYGYGGNVYMTGGRLIRCQVIGGAASWDQYCTTTSYGSGIYATGGVIDTCLVKGGYATQNAYCGGVYLAGEVSLINCTVTENSAPMVGTVGVGVHVASAKAKVLNCVIYGNGGTPEREFGTANLDRFRFCASTVTNASCASWLLIGATDFADSRLNGDYRILPGSRLVDAGSDEDKFYPAEASAYDIDGKARKSGTAIDIGFSEVDQSGLSCNGYPSTYGAFVDTLVTFHAFSMGAKGPVKYKWRFGDGTETETDFAAFDYSYQACGLYNVSLAASDDNGTTWTAWHDVPIQLRVSPAEVFVNASSASPAYPYATRDAGAHTIAEALLSLTNNLSRGLAYGEGVKVRICTGTYTETGFELNHGVTVCGDTGNPADVTIVDEVINKRAFAIGHPDARVEDLTISGKGLRYNITGAAEGGHVRMTDGTIENCIISGGQAANGYNSYGYGGNVYMTGGRLLRCQILSGAASVLWCTTASYGSGIYAKGGLIDSCIIKDNKGEQYSFCGGAYLNGPVTMANCLVVGNITPQVGGIGIRLASTDARAVNTIVLKSRTSVNDQEETADKNYGTSNLANYIHCASLTENAAGTECKVISEADFVQYSSGDYHLLKTSDLVDGGVDRSAYTSLVCSDKDFDGLNRVSGKAIDIGCYEYDQDSKSCGGGLSTYGALRGADVVFTAMASGMSGDVTYEWDFGDGSGLTTEAESVTRAYATCGNFVVRVRASDDGGSNWTPWQKTASDIVIAPAVTYVDATNTHPLAPYDTKETAANTIGAVLATMTNSASADIACVSGAVVRVCRGEFAESGIVLKDAISIVGDTGNLSDVVIVDSRAGSRAFTIEHAGARVAYLTVRGTGLGVAFGEGGHVRMTAGEVVNCVISNGIAGANNQVGYGGNVYMAGGRLRNCQILGGSATQGVWCDKGLSSGSGVWASGGVVENCLVKDNCGKSYSTAGGVYLSGSAVAVNCTIVGNTASYLPMGIGIGSGTARAVNCVIFGNGTAAGVEFGTANLAQYSYCASSEPNAQATGWQVIDESAFRNYEQKDVKLKSLQPVRGGALHNTGSDWNTYQALGAVSTVDLLGQNRKGGRRLDIGCFELAVGGTMLFLR